MREDVSGAIEALLLLAEEPMSEPTLAAALDVPVPVVHDTLLELVAFYDETGRGFELRELGGGWRYYTREEHADVVAAYVLEGRESKLSQAGLETLAVVAYQQPISRARISAIRGVNVDGVIKTLVSRGLVAEIGSDDVSGAVLFGTTTYFLERMGLRSLDDLPPLAPHLPEVDELEAELSRLADVDTRAEPVEAQEQSPSTDPVLSPSTGSGDSSTEQSPSTGSGHMSTEQSPSTGSGHISTGQSPSTLRQAQGRPSSGPISTEQSPSTGSGHEHE